MKYPLSTVLQGSTPEQVAAFEFPNLAKLCQESQAQRGAEIGIHSTWKSLDHCIRATCSSFENFGWKTSVDAHFVIFDVDATGMHHYRHLNYRPNILSTAYSSTPRDYMATYGQELRQATRNPELRIIMVDMTGVATVDLFTLDMLCGALGLDADTLWYIFRQANTLSDIAFWNHSLRHPNFLNEMQMPWEGTRSLTIGSIHIIFLDDKQSTLPSQQPFRKCSQFGHQLLP